MKQFKRFRGQFCIYLFRGKCIHFIQLIEEVESVFILFYLIKLKYARNKANFKNQMNVYLLLQKRLTRSGRIAKCKRK